MMNRDIPELIESLRIRALALTGETWERDATRDMMKEAAQRLEDILIGHKQLHILVEGFCDAIRAHRDARGDDRCWQDDEALYALLPEGYTPPARDTSVELELCRAYIASRQHPATVYVSPQREIDRFNEVMRMVKERADEMNRDFGNQTSDNARGYLVGWVNALRWVLEIESVK